MPFINLTTQSGPAPTELSFVSASIFTRFNGGELLPSSTGSPLLISLLDLRLLLARSVSESLEATLSV